jgi:signal transduction histidine kinase
MQVWVPQLLDGRADSVLRVAAVAHLGEVLGLIVVERDPGSTPFTDEEDTVLVELARQVGLALHNVRLDSALQASLDELEQRNAELQASRSRIVAASDESRRRIERNLHDGAQQHLVALAVKVGLVKQLLGADPDTAQALLDELRGDVQATLTELRELAHGIYPPLLRDRGLPEALRAAAGRSVLPASVSADGIGRYETDVEAAVYFCVLEAMQNAGKHAGDGAEVRVTVRLEDDDLCFDVVDDGAGFDAARQTVLEGHGFVNMRDRLGAIGGTLDVLSSPGAGTQIRGRIPHPTPIGEPATPPAAPDSPPPVATPSSAPAQVRAPAQ